MLYPSPPGIAASAIVITILLVALAHSLQLLAYMYFTVAAIPHLSTS